MAPRRGASVAIIAALLLSAPLIHAQPAAPTADMRCRVFCGSPSMELRAGSLIALDFSASCAAMEGGNRIVARLTHRRRTYHVRVRAVSRLPDLTFRARAMDDDSGTVIYNAHFPAHGELNVTDERYHVSVQCQDQPSGVTHVWPALAAPAGSTPADDDSSTAAPAGPGI